MTFEVFRFWDCSVSKCVAASAIDIGACERCMRHFCARHVTSSAHPCEKDPLDDASWNAAKMQELKTLRDKVQDKALLQRCSSLNGGLSCELDASDPLGKSLMGGMHIHLRIRFSNGTTWLARILRLNYTSFSDDFSNRVLESECATLKWLEKVNVPIPIPKLHGYGLRNDARNEVGVAYMLIDELPGTPLLLKQPSEGQLHKVYSQWTEYLNALHTCPLKEIGSLSFQKGNGEIEIGPIIGDRTGTFPQMGPFDNARDYYSTHAEKYLELISDGQLCSAYPINAYLIFKHLKQLAVAGRWNIFEPELDEGPFFLKHTDDKGDHILVDDEYNITGVIDWTYARVVPAFEAFGPSLLTADLNDLFNGNPGPTSNDKLITEVFKDSDILRFAAGPDLVRRFSFGLAMGMGTSLEEAKCLTRGIISTASGIPIDLDLEMWYQDRIYEWADDTRLQALLLQQGKTVKLNNEPKASISEQVPRFATCSMSDCTRAALRGMSCAKCKRHLCAEHSSDQYHNCPSSSELSDEEWEKSVNDEVWELLSHVNTHELVRIGTQLNGGKCKFERGKHIGMGAIMGCANYHGWLVFDNGERWVVRIPRTGFSDVPLDLVEYLVESEYATLKFLESTKVPAPKPFAYGLGSDPSNRVGVSYILMQALPGKPFYGYMASESQKTHVIEQLADVLIEISKNPLPSIGSLVVNKGQLVPSIGPVASNRFITLKTYGPFDTASYYLVSIIEQHLDLIADGQLYSDYPAEAFLFYFFLRQNIQYLTSTDMQGQFFLKHVDDKGDHILVDEDFNITGVIDWQFARIVPAAEAFGPSYVTADLGSLYSSNTGINSDDRILAKALHDRGADALASIAERDELMRRFHTGLASGFTKDEACDLMKGMVSCVRNEEVGDFETWVAKQSEECSGDPRWKNVQALQAKQF
ncbi:hypothetical protein N7456_011918 [Penicillium angulare]|uniref:AN1-type domain-containing protein n=1 Tax=Penicillium angulare TaxID=116970 RepID=A0A9W9EUJ4_9EURO|nr:hypothetical protein N7456_011918 [Penicillium angulare]